MITNNASVSEKKSPYFDRNKAFCDQFEDFVLKRNGKVKGSYNAWSYSIIGKITEPSVWTFIYKKATFSSGNLFLKTKYQNVLTSAVWQTRNVLKSNFKIRKRSKWDYFNLYWFKSFTLLSLSDRYVIEHDMSKINGLEDLLSLLQPLLLSGEIYSIENQNADFRIELRTEEHHFHILEQLINLEKLKLNSKA